MNNYKEIKNKAHPFRVKKRTPTDNQMFDLKQNP